MHSEDGHHGTDRNTDRPLFTDVNGTLISMQDVVGRKWQPIIVYHLLEDGPLGFSALKERIDEISSKMLSDSLDELESAGLVCREILSDKPVRVEYSLTEEGAALEDLIREMVQWGASHDFDGEPTAATDSRPRAATDGGRVEGR